MNVLDMMKSDINSVIGLTLSLDLGGSKPIIGEVDKVSRNQWVHSLDGEQVTWYSYSVSFGGCGYYPVDCLTKIVDSKNIIF
jgi:hypothetical protein